MITFTSDDLICVSNHPSFISFSGKKVKGIYLLKLGSLKEGEYTLSLGDWFYLAGKVGSGDLVFKSFKEGVWGTPYLSHSPVVSSKPLLPITKSPPPVILSSIPKPSSPPVLKSSSPSKESPSLKSVPLSTIVSSGSTLPFITSSCLLSFNPSWGVVLSKEFVSSHPPKDVLLVTFINDGVESICGKQLKKWFKGVEDEAILSVLLDLSIFLSSPSVINLLKEGSKTDEYLVLTNHVFRKLADLLILYIKKNLDLPRPKLLKFIDFLETQCDKVFPDLST